MKQIARTALLFSLLLAAVSVTHWIVNTPQRPEPTPQAAPRAGSLIGECHESTLLIVHYPAGTTEQGEHQVDNMLVALKLCSWIMHSGDHDWLDELLADLNRRSGTESGWRVEFQPCLDATKTF